MRRITRFVFLEAILEMIKKLLSISILFTALTCGLSAQSIELSFFDIELKCSTIRDSSKFIIRNDAEFYQLTNCIRPSIDFKRYSVIGVVGSVGGCKRPEVGFRVIKDIGNKRYLIEAVVYQFGACKRLNYYRHFICVEKLDDDYEIRFEVSKVNKR